MKLRHLAATTAALAWMAFPAPAAACPTRDLASALRTSDVAFVGTVEGVSNGVATVNVSEVWRGLDLPAVVEVAVASPDAPGGSTGDRIFKVGTRYLLLPFLSEEGFEDDACSLTQPWTDGLAKLRPATARPPLHARPSVGLSTPLLIALVASSVAAVGALVAFAVSRRAKPQ